MKLSPLLAPEGLVRKCVSGKKQRGGPRDDFGVEIRFLITGCQLMRKEMQEETVKMLICAFARIDFFSGNEIE